MSRCSLRARDSAGGTSASTITATSAMPPQAATREIRGGSDSRLPTPTPAIAISTAAGSNMYRPSPGQPCSENATSTITHAHTPAASASVTRSRRTTAIATASSAVSSITAGLRSKKRPIVPNTRSLRRRRPDPSAFDAATNGLREVSAGIPNHSTTSSTIPPTIIHRMDGTRSHAQIEYRPRNSHTSGRPSDASAPSTHAQRQRPHRWQSIAARHSATIIGSDWALSM